MITDPSGNPMTRRELLRRIGRLEQVAGIEPFVFDDGPARGVLFRDLLCVEACHTKTENQSRGCQMSHWYPPRE